MTPHQVKNCQTCVSTHRGLKGVILLYSWFVPSSWRVFQLALCFSVCIALNWRGNTSKIETTYLLSIETLLKAMLPQHTSAARLKGSERAKGFNTAILIDTIFCHA